MVFNLDATIEVPQDLLHSGRVMASHLVYKSLEEDIIENLSRVEDDGCNL